ncbi:MAG: DNA polymerase I [Ignavibacteriae bacterium]|nr:DNA polymerase I [Ignavibacteriota bacterium]
MKRERLFLLDGMALAYRAYFTFISRPLINSKGVNTSAIYGFVNTLIKILDEEKPEHVAVVFDTKEPTFRHVMYQPYKATRQKMPEDMSEQMDKLKEVVEAFNVPLIELPGYEADDIMGTLAKKAEGEGIETYLVTGDKDFMQLISPQVKMYKPGKMGNEWEIVDEQGVKDKFGVTPDKVPDVLGLIGDKSDNVPGVPGVGEKTAIPLVQEYGSIENILKNIKKITQKGLREKLEKNHDYALLSKKLVTIDTNVPLKVDIYDLQARPQDRKKLYTLFSELEFKSLLRKLTPAPVPETEDISFDVTELELTDISTDEHSYHLIATEEEFKKCVSILKKSSLFVFDTETTGTDPLRAELVGLSFAVKSREAWYVPVSTEQGAMSREQRAESAEQRAVSKELRMDSLFSNPKSEIRNPKSSFSNLEPQTSNQFGFNLSYILKHLSPIFSDPSIKKLGQNIKYDMLVLAAHGIKTEGVVFDTMVANYVLRPDGQHNLDALAAEHLNYKMISYDELTGVGKDRKDIREIDVKKLAEYSAQDADITCRLYETLKAKLTQANLLKLCEEIEFPLITVLADMELAGVKLDTNFLADLSKELERMLDNVTIDIYNLAGEKFNINSTQQLSKILFDKLKLSIVRKTKTGFSTDVGVLETLRHEHPIVEKLLDYRQLQKLKSTYVDALPALINPRTGKLHTSFNQTIAATGRLSSSDPNLQNIPIRTEIGRSIRQAFIPSGPDMLILDADYSQIELRVMAHISGDEGLTEAFRNGEDIHATTAAKVFGVLPHEITREMRRKAKEVNFGIMYGIGPYGLATRLDISQSEAKEIINKYFERFPKVNQYIFDTIAKAKHDGYVSTLLGRRRYLPDINSRNQNVRSNAERQAINMPIQGTAADMIKLAMVNIHRKIQDVGFKIHMLLQVHDELVFEVAKSEERRAKSIIVKEMQNALPLSVPIAVEVGVGKNWLEAH